MNNSPYARSEPEFAVSPIEVMLEDGLVSARDANDVRLFSQMGLPDDAHGEYNDWSEWDSGLKLTPEQVAEIESAVELWEKIRAAQALVDLVLSMPGKKIVTVASPYMGAQGYDVRGKSIGHAPEHASVFFEHVGEAIDNGGGVIVRTFTGRKTMVNTPRGEMMLPIKQVRGISCGRGRWIRLSAEEMLEASTQDAKTGEPIERERAVEYPEWSF
jgi:hypothetical protein